MISNDSEEKQLLDKKIKEGASIIEMISKLKYEIARDHILKPIPADGEPSVELYNDELSQLAKKKSNTWFTAPWLYAEGYLYRLLRSYFVQTQHWSSRDPFYEQKMKTFQHSATSIFKISTIMHGLDSDMEGIRSDPEKLEVLFNEMIQMCLWGNATDLSLLTHLSEDDIRHLQSVGKEAQAARKQFILKDDQEAIWNHVQSLRGDRIDFILDNSGFELYTDLVFADFLVTYTPYVCKVVFQYVPSSKLLAKANSWYLSFFKKK